MDGDNKMTNEKNLVYFRNYYYYLFSALRVKNLRSIIQRRIYRKAYGAYRQMKEAKPAFPAVGDK
jgi:hypothetical protein